MDGVPVEPEKTKRYVLLNKPSGYVCSLSDEKGRPVAADLLAEKYPERLYNVGRLDMYSSGAILFTNDGEFAAKVGHPSSEIEKQYIVEASMPFRDDVIEAFRKGIRIDNVYYRCRDAVRLSSRRMSITLIEGKPRDPACSRAFFDTGKEPDQNQDRNSYHRRSCLRRITGTYGQKWLPCSVRETS